tara:strand:- start:347 stop:490 length:144 start_codon:yes stop_codon:yes gene_type:complete
VSVEDGVEIEMNVAVYRRLLTVIHGYVVSVVGSTGVKDGHVIIKIVE